MKFLLLVSLCIALASLASLSDASTIRPFSLHTQWSDFDEFYLSKTREDTVRYYEQKLDHFNSSDTQTWKQRYTVNETFGDGNNGSPLFIFLAGEAPMGFFEFQEVQAHYWASLHNASYIVLEHRFYGKSLPFDLLTTENLYYHRSQQALADAAQFLQWYNSTRESPGPWVVIGCSYSGALSAWFRAQYPELVVASVAPSGPVLAQANYSSYLGLFSQVAPQPCVQATIQAVAQIQTLLSTSSGQNELEKKFNSCNRLTAQNRFYFLWTISQTLGGSDQMDNPPDWPLNDTCTTMTSSSDVVGNWGKLFSQTTCNPFSEQEFIDAARATIPNSNRAWWWQKCTEYGFFKTSYPGTSVFFPDLDLEHIQGYCAKIFDLPNMTPNTTFTNAYYGGQQLNATNVLFTNGLIDPWHLLSITEDVPSPSQVKAVTYEAGHCATLTATDSSQDPSSLTQARSAVVDFLAEVLGTGTAHSAH